MKKKRKPGTLLILLGFLLLIGAAGLTAYNLIEDYQAGLSAKKILEEIPDKEPQLDENGQAEYEKYPDMEMPTVKINGRYYIGKLTFPDIGITVPVQANYKFSYLTTSPCRYSGSIYTNDMIICGHNYRTHFGKLVWLDPGDQVIFKDVDGNEFTYEIGSIEILDASDGEKMTKDGDWDLTLFTCSFSGDTRRTLRCYLEND